MNNNLIFIHFDVYNLNKINYVINFVFKNYSDIKHLKFIFIVHIKRNFSIDDKKIFSVPDIISDVYQLFIDNLNGPDIKLNNITRNSIQYFINNNYINLEDEFNKAIKKYTENYLEKNNNLENLEKAFRNNMDLRPQVLEKLNHI